MLRVHVALLHALGKLDFLVRRKQRHLADFLQIHAHGIVDGDALGRRQVVETVVRHRRRISLADGVFLDNFDVQFRQRVENLIELIGLHLAIGKLFDNFLDRQRAFLFSGFNQFPDAIGDHFRILVFHSQGTPFGGRR